jgi:hypothetical protein
VELGGEASEGDLLRELYLPNFLFRTGINRKAEFRFGITSFSADSFDNQSDEKIMFTSLSVKYRIFDEKNGWPSVAVQPEVVLPFGDNADKIQLTDPNISLMSYSLLMLFNNIVHEKVFVNYNLGALWTNQFNLDYLVSISTSFAHTHKLGYFFEVYSIFNDLYQPICFDGGITYLVMPRFQIDIYGGSRAAEGHKYRFYGAGIGFRIDRDDLKKESFKKTGIHH